MKKSRTDFFNILLESARALQERGQDLYRQAHGLLGADEIRALRQGLGLTQAQFAALLHLGLNTVSRWESGQNGQSKAMELLLKIIRDVPGALGDLEQQAAKGALRSHTLASARR